MKTQMPTTTQKRTPTLMPTPRLTPTRLPTRAGTAAIGTIAGAAAAPIAPTGESDPIVKTATDTVEDSAGITGTLGTLDLTLATDSVDCSDGSALPNTAGSSMSLLVLGATLTALGGVIVFSRRRGFGLN